MSDEIRPILRLLTYPDGSTIEANKESVLVGRHSEADVILPMPDISRRHCRFVRTPSGWKVIDLASTNGTFVNGMRVEEADVKPGDRIRVGGVMFELFDSDSRKAG